MALETIQGNHPTLGIILAFMFMIIKPCAIWTCNLPTFHPRLATILLRLPEKGFPKLILSPKYFLIYCSVEQEVRLRSLVWVFGNPFSN